jgi:hypothetical protein
VDVDGVQRGWQCYPLPLAVDGRPEGFWRWSGEAAERLYWYLEEGVTSEGPRQHKVPMLSLEAMFSHFPKLHMEAQEAWQ